MPTHGPEPSANICANVFFWPAAWFGTTVAGLSIAHDCDPLILGFVVATVGIFGFFLQTTIAILTWAFWLSRFRIAAASIAGALTGVLVTFFLTTPAARSASFLDKEVIPAALACAAGGGIGGFLHLCWLTRTKPCLDHFRIRGHRVTKREILLHLTVFLAVVLIWTTVVALIFHAWSNDRKVECSMRLKEIWRVLESYEAKHGVFLPAYTSDAKGTPLSSWRMRVTAYDSYHDTFHANVDFSQPWNSPDIRSHSLFYRSPVSHNPQNSDFTDYVAVVGPGTFWDPKQQLAIAKIADKSNWPRQIVVVEWPRSDIHWAEPRDITVEEFLDWFRSKHGRGDGNHPGCLMYVDAQGNVGTLRNGTDPEEVRRMLMGEDVAN
jgi:hypothetical protein